MTEASAKTYSPKADRWAVAVSVLCLAHCLLTPVLFLVLPAVNAYEHAGHFHEVTFFILFGVAGIAFYKGYMLHRKPQVLVLAGLGFSALIMGLVFHQYALIITGAGSAALIVAHLWNMQYCRCACCDTH